MKAHIFREYDVRGLVDIDLTDDVAYKLGLGLGTMIARNGGTSIAVGRDCRESSTRFLAHINRGLTEVGLDVYDVGVGPTPMVYFAANTLPVDGLAMITGSHNPPEYNGFKIGVGKTTMHGSDIQKLKELIFAGDFAKLGRKGRVQSFDILAPYMHFVRQTVASAKRPLKIVVDAGNGVGGSVAVPLYKSMGYDVVPLFCEMDARFPNHHPDPTVEENLHHLIAKVKEEKADLGIAFDGDADRIGVVDETGRIWWGDELMIVLSRDVLKQEPGAAIVGEVKCSFTLYDDIKKNGGQPVMWKAGHSLIKAKMKETHAMLAGEMSGHIFYKQRYFGFDDAVYTGARLLEILSGQPRPMSALKEGVPETFSSPEIRVDIGDEQLKFAIVREATSALRSQGHQVVDVDGVRVTFADGWGLIRASNTQPILVVRYEATSKSRLAEIESFIQGTIAQAKKVVASA